MTSSPMSSPNAPSAYVNTSTVPPHWSHFFPQPSNAAAPPPPSSSSPHGVPTFVPPVAKTPHGSFSQNANQSRDAPSIASLVSCDDQSTSSPGGAGPHSFGLSSTLNETSDPPNASGAPNAVGMDPLRSFFSSHSTFSLGSDASSAGMVPTSRLSSSLACSNAGVPFHMPAGTAPLRVEGPYEATSGWS